MATNTVPNQGNYQTNQNFDIDINHRDQYGMSYLEHAILMGSFDMVDLLIRYGCDLYQG